MYKIKLQVSPLIIKQKDFINWGLKQVLFDCFIAWKSVNCKDRMVSVAITKSFRYNFDMHDLKYTWLMGDENNKVQGKRKKWMHCYVTFVLIKRIEWHDHIYVIITTSSYINRIKGEKEMKRRKER